MGAEGLRSCGHPDSDAGPSAQHRRRHGTSSAHPPAEQRPSAGGELLRHWLQYQRVAGSSRKLKRGMNPAPSRQRTVTDWETADTDSTEGRKKIKAHAERYRRLGDTDSTSNRHRQRGTDPDSTGQTSPASMGHQPSKYHT
ncbi:hypothetical protein CPLU01_04766 [Colletotrichum plurivorum]|uniref:Uncharacterized protein n=1 Tax=Colletotrichum plurivorum TaxID=2175906 RepID=A0A8H6KNB9_9PEZI|nr:hypothetical protein CPLU01_04766 [Colletotrichum plurivorum]